MATSNKTLACNLGRILCNLKSLRGFSSTPQRWHVISPCCQNNSNKISMHKPTVTLYTHRNFSNCSSLRSDSFDRIDRHVSLGQGSEKLEDSKQYTSLNNRIGEFRPQKVLLLTKVSRYQFERQSHDQHLSETEFREIIEKRGSDYTQIKYYHNVHKAVEEKLVKALEKRGLEVQICQPMNYTCDLIDWADVVVTAGGDGTFLLGASRIRGKQQKPIMGINTDPTRSEGHLCLPKHWSLNVDDAIQFLLEGKFRWKYRRRLRLTMTGQKDKLDAPAMELYTQQLQYPEYRYLDTADHDVIREQTISANRHQHEDKENDSIQPKVIEEDSAPEGEKLCTKTLPILALNEVFIGESLSSRVSYILVKFDDDPSFIKSRNSGLIVSTGTGSTSWTYNVNKLTHQSVENILRIIFETTGQQINFKDPSVIEAVTNRFNNDIRFDPELNVMAYTIRDPISMGLTSATSLSPERILDIQTPTSSRKPRGKASRINVKSKCFDAHLVIDGAMSYKFDDGMEVVIEIKDEDALKTIEISNG